MKESQISAKQNAAIEKIKILMREYAFAIRPAFLYTQKEMLKNMEIDLLSLDKDYIKKHNIPDVVIKNLAKEVYGALMEKGEYDRAITLAEHYKL